MKNLRTNTVLEWTQSTLNVPGRTVELQLPGTMMIMTDNIENIRAVMSTQVTTEMLDIRYRLKVLSLTTSAKETRTARSGEA